MQITFATTVADLTPSFLNFIISHSRFVVQFVWISARVDMCFQFHWNQDRLNAPYRSQNVQIWCWALKARSTHTIHELKKLSSKLSNIRTHRFKLVAVRTVKRTRRRYFQVLIFSKHRNAIHTTETGRKPTGKKTPMFLFCDEAKAVPHYSARCWSLRS